MQIDGWDASGEPVRGGKVHNAPSTQGPTRAARRLNSKNARRRIAQKRTRQALRIGRRGGLT